MLKIALEKSSLPNGVVSRGSRQRRLTIFGRGLHLLILLPKPSLLHLQPDMYCSASEKNAGQLPSLLTSASTIWGSWACLRRLRAACRTRHSRDTARRSGPTRSHVSQPPQSSSLAAGSTYLLLALLLPILGSLQAGWQPSAVGPHSVPSPAGRVKTLWRPENLPWMAHAREWHGSVLRLRSSWEDL